ncbi:MAG: phage/plasmid primase, P4 family [Rhodoferax sp.]|nr:phage/plasmid primase, P4 family [Rhodoferax sp.]
MATVLPLVTQSPPSTAKNRSFLSIVKALQLDDIQVPEKNKARRDSSPNAIPQAQASNDCGIPESGRNNTLTNLAGAMRRKGMSEAAINAALQAENLARCRPPLDLNEVSGIAASIMRYPKSNTEDVLKSLNDAGNAIRFGRRYQCEILYVYGLGWVIWDHLCWRRDRVGKIMESAKQVARDIYQEGEALDDDDARIEVARHARSSQQAPRLKATLELAQSLPELVTEIHLLDAHDMLLGVGNGVINLKMGKLQPARREDLMTRHIPVAYDATAQCPQFEAFIGQVTGGDKTLAQYLQRVVGYSLTGRTYEQCIFFLYGNGANGKSTFLNLVKELLGTELASQTPSETLMAKRSTSTNDIARLQGVRVVIANEIEDGSLLAESLVKQMTGGEALTAKFHYQEYFEFTPKFKLFIAGNHKPMIRGRDNGIWRRIRLIPFEVTIPPQQRDKHLQEKLRTELPGILNWAIKGCLDWQNAGLTEPTVVTNAVTSYREEMDVIGQWMQDCCTVAANLECKSGNAYQSYKIWAEQNGYKPMAAGTFSRDFAYRFKRVKRNDGNYFEGIKIS